MDIYTAALLGALLIVVSALAFRALGTQADLARERLETERMKSAWYQQMAKSNPKTNGKGSKKARKQQEDDDDGLEDPIEHVLDHPVVRGIANRYGVDVDLVLDGDEREIAKVDALLARVPAGLAGGANAGAFGGGQLPPPLS